MWFLSPSGWPTNAADGSLFAARLAASGWQPIDDSQVQPAVDAYNAGQPGPTPPDYVDTGELAAELGGYVRVGEAQVHVSRHATGSGVETTAVQAALDAAGPGGTVVFDRPPSGSYTLDGSLAPYGGQRLLSAPGVELRQTAWAAPVFDLLDVDDVSVHGFRLVYTGTKAENSPAIRGENRYNLNCGVWTNGNRNRVTGVVIDGFAVGVDFAAWDTATQAITATMRRDNTADRVLVTGCDFGVLWLCQQGLRINDLTARDLVDSSGGTNPLHAFYGTGTATLRSADVQITNTLCDGNALGAAFQAKYVDGLTFRGGIAERCTGLVSLIDGTDNHISDLIYRNGVGTEEAILLVQKVTDPPKRLKVTDVTIAATTDTATPPAVKIIAEDYTVDQVTVTSQRSAVADDHDVQLRGARCAATGLTVINLGAEGRALVLGDSITPAAGMTIRGLRTRGARQVIDVQRGSTGIVLDVDPADQRSTGTWPNKGIGPVGTGAEPEIVYASRHSVGAGGRAGSYHGAAAAQIQSNIAFAADVVRAAPLVLARTVAVDTFAVEVITAAAGATVRLGIYASGYDGYPGRLVHEAGTVAADTTGVKTIAVPAFNLLPGLYWLVGVAQGGSPTLRSVTPIAHPAVAPTAVATSAPSVYAASIAAGAALPAIFPTSVATSFYAAYVQVRTQKPV